MGTPLLTLLEWEHDCYAAFMNSTKRTTCSSRVRTSSSKA